MQRAAVSSPRVEPAAAVRSFNAAAGPSVSAEEMDVRLRAACYEYYTAQQALLGAENDHLTLRSTVERLKHELGQQQGEVRRLKDVLQHLQAERQRTSMTDAAEIIDTVDAEGNHATRVQRPFGAHDLDRFLSQEKALYTSISDAFEAKALVQKATDDLFSSAEAEARSTRLLDEAVEGQGRFNVSMIAEHRAMKEQMEVATDRLGKAMARKAQLEREWDRVSQEEQTLAKAVRARSAKVEKVVENLRERDMDAARLRRDHALAERLRLGEIEHAREQEATLEHLIAENRRLRQRIALRRDGRPVLFPAVDRWLKRGGGGAAAEGPLKDAASSSANALAANAASPLESSPSRRHHGTTGAAGGERGGFLRAADPPRSQSAAPQRTAPPSHQHNGHRPVQPPVYVVNNDDYDIVYGTDQETSMPLRLYNRYRALAQSRHIVEKVKDRNVALLQQVVSTMKSLQMEVGRSTGAKAAAVKKNDNKEGIADL